MRLSELGEFGFIDRIAALVGDDPRIVLGIGDDAALLDLGGPQLVAVTTDAMLQDRHFRLEWLAAGEIGWRAAAGALSDIAAMGATPVSVFCTVALPPDTDVTWGEALLDGIERSADDVGATLTGGDVIAGERVLVDIMVLGQVPRGQQLTRDGAAPGQLLAVTGALGGAAAAVAALSERGPEALAAEELTEVRRRFTHPRARVDAGRAIAASGLARAAIDLSDGLVQDAGHIAERSGVRAVIEARRVPMVDGCDALAEELSADALTWALAGGEDFELLIALPDEHAEALAQLPEVAAVGLTIVGRIEAGSGAVALGADGSPLDLPRSGWDHFA